MNTNDGLRFKLNLDSDAGLTITTHSLDEVHWGFRYHARYPDPDGRVGMVIDYRLSVRYQSGLLPWGPSGLPWPDDQHRVCLTMNVTLPKKRGVRFAWGADVSPGSAAWFEFYYVPAKEPVRLDIAPDIPVAALRLCEVFGGEMGKFQRIALPEPEPGSLVVPRPPVDIPFPLNDIVTPRAPFGPYRIPFLHEDNGVRWFEFPESILPPPPRETP